MFANACLARKEHLRGMAGFLGHLELGYDAGKWKAAQRQHMPRSQNEYTAIIQAVMKRFICWLLDDKDGKEQSRKLTYLVWQTLVS